MKPGIQPARQTQAGANTAQAMAMWKLAWRVVLAMTMWCIHPAPAATVLWKAPNVQAYLGLPYGDLEFENPLSGTEQVIGHPVLDWCDADYVAEPPNGQYKDWHVYSAGGMIDGSATEIWMHATGQYIWTTTRVPSPIVSVHLFGDFNDGIAGIYVDDQLVARVQMAHPIGETALLIVRGLPPTLHTIKIACEQPDIAVLGAAALAEKPLKWNQPPEPAINLVYYGWNQLSVDGMRIAADDWVCISSNPITTVRWWGSYIGWISNVPPPTQASRFKIGFWTDVPAGGAAEFSHPGTLLNLVECREVICEFAGWDYDPRTGLPEACFKFEANFTPDQYFYQGPSNTVYWISICAVYDQGSPSQWLWGWKTRPRDPNSPAPDAAVISCEPPPPWTPITWPDPNTQWDLAFELVSDFKVGVAKWTQAPDLTTNGMDVNISSCQQWPLPGYFAGDDYLCIERSWITNITIFGSWSNDVPVNPLPTFKVSFWNDVPASPTNYSRPGQQLWEYAFPPGTYRMTELITPQGEWWLTPPDDAKFPGDRNCVEVSLTVPPESAFYQLGTPALPRVYWLVVQAEWPDQMRPGFFGWKTSPSHWNDAAVWAAGQVSPNPAWNELLYPPRHPLAGRQVDLAFILEGYTRIYELKWSQPPITSNAPASFNGWNELSVYRASQIVADDWVCLTTNPVTDVHWWGSFVGWTSTNPPAQMPDAFVITLWTDVPAGAQNPFSHPGTNIWLYRCTNYACYFAGWDWDPCNPDRPPEACFKFECDLAQEFRQLGPSNIYWVSIAAEYHDQWVTNAWGWKTRPRDPGSLAPDAAARIFDPTAPLPGSIYLRGEPITCPHETNLWDMAFQLTTRATTAEDFGDAPDEGARFRYPTKLANTGARHYILPGFCLGREIDAEPDGQPSIAANGDDIIGVVDDEDGVDMEERLLRVGTVATVNVWLTSPSGIGKLDAWLDLNRDGEWSATEKIFDNVSLTSGNNVLSFAVPNTARLGPSYARFRLSSVGGLPPFGAAPDGEVEDYRFYLVQPPITNIVITNIAAVQSVSPTCQVVSVQWIAQTNVHYQLQAVTNLTGAPTNLFWFDIGPEVIGPTNVQTDETCDPERYYRVIAPYVEWP